LEIDSTGISCCFDKESERMLKDYRNKGLHDSSKSILAKLQSLNLKDRNVLELGCGLGGLTIALVGAGAASGTGMDLSPKMIETAQRLASEAGLSGKASFRVGDGATATLSPADFVVLDSVLCCYPSVTTLLDNSSSAARRYYAISIPDDRRSATRLLKVFLPLQGIFMRRGSFRFHIHPIEMILGRLKDKGFRAVFDSKVGWIW
jgi:SAM-dependent methyltransferase